MTRLLIASSILILTVASACGDDDYSRQDDGGHDGSPIANTDFCDQWGAVVTDLAECMGENTIDVDTRECESNLMGGVAAGTTEYDGAKAGECLGMMNGSCETMLENFLFTPPEACMSVFRGTIAPGGECYDTEECLDGYCEDYDACPGVCVGYAGLGESCMEASCDDGLSCDWNNDACIPELTEGDSCTGGDCAAGLSCAQDGTCTRVKFASLGEGCDATTFCLPPSTCDEATLECVALTPVGGTCDPEQWGRCADGAVCNPNDNTCTLTAVGDPCITVDEGDWSYTTCSSDLECNNDVCEEYVDDRMTCYRP